MRKVLFNKKGVSLAELIACIVVLALVMTLVGRVMFETNRNFNWVDRQWTIQEEIKFIMDALLRDTASGSLSTSTSLDLLREDMDAAKANGTFASCSELGSFTEAEDGTLTFENANTSCIYIFNYDEQFYILNRGQTEAKPFVLFDEINIVAEFSIGTNAFKSDTYDQHNDPQMVDIADGTVSYRDYVPNSLTVTIRSSEEYLPNEYHMESSYALKNMEGQKINITDNYLSSKYVAGWTATLENWIRPYYKDYLKLSESEYVSANQTANIVRYTSSAAAFGEAELEVGNNEMPIQAGCTTRFLMIGQRFETPVIDSLHDFRDNVLKGNPLGELVIEKYYAWSPAIIELASKFEFVETSLRWCIVHFAMLVD